MPICADAAELGLGERKRSFAGLADGQHAARVAPRTPAPASHVINGYAQFSFPGMPSSPPAFRGGTKLLSQEALQDSRRRSLSAGGRGRGGDSG